MKFIYEGNPVRKIMDDGDVAYLPSFFVAYEFDGKRYQSRRFESWDEANNFVQDVGCEDSDNWIET